MSISLGLMNPGF